jgi:hypothetical protein
VRCVRGRSGLLMHRAAMLCVAAILVGCGGGSDALHVSLDDVDPSGGFWTIRATCTGGHLQVEFRPGEQLSVPDLGHASSEEIAVECGKPERVAVSDEELRRHTPTGADLAEPTFEPTLLRRRRFSCGRGPPGLVAEHHRRGRLPRPAQRRHNRQRGDREGGVVRGPGLGAAVVAGALQAGIANVERGR